MSIISKPVTVTVTGNAFTSTKPSAIGSALSEGSTAEPARIDHIHTVASDVVSYDNATSGLTATDVKAALDEVVAEAVALASTAPEDLGVAAVGNGTTAARANHVHKIPVGGDISYTNTTTGMTATTLQAAIDELWGIVNTHLNP